MESRPRPRLVAAASDESSSSGESKATGQKAQTQDRIVSAAMSLFATGGYERTSIAAIAEQAGVSRSAVFWHFGDKEGLFREAFRRMLGPFFAEIQAGLRGVPPRDRVLEILAKYERVVDENEPTIRSIVRFLLESETLRKMLQDALFPLHDGLIADVRAALVADGKNDAEGRAMAAALVALLDGNLLLGMLDPTAANRDLRRAGLRHIASRVFGPDDDG
ncbi:MAG: TetR/AcrR family transcriptional regulator [Myxococcota bacterium]